MTSIRVELIRAVVTVTTVIVVLTYAHFDKTPTALTIATGALGGYFGVSAPASAKPHEQDKP